MPSRPSDAVKLRVADARLTAGERLLAAGDKAGALAVYKSLIASNRRRTSAWPQPAGCCWPAESKSSRRWQVA